MERARVVGKTNKVKQVPILEYDKAPARFLPYDTDFPIVAAMLAALIRHHAPQLEVEHIGSTAVPDCGGKGIVDLVVSYQPGEIAIARDAIDHLGFQRQTAGHAFPESRPMRVGSVVFNGKHYRIHAHILEHACAEHLEMQWWRDELIHNPSLKAAYESEKKRILEDGLSEPLAYTQAKSGFIESALAPRRQKDKSKK
ncbi:GrpB family protein [Chitinivorax sp. B]|uniref:GrpB family protein n=1 Tax=Chitinivorax sp. B TaxID=2502235 RepID=UPI0014851336|nr:GrpB family protein [Chitinivorax sp. B]